MNKPKKLTLMNIKDMNAHPRDRISILQNELNANS